MGHQERFSADSSDIARNKTIYVESLNSFPDPVGNVITLENETIYIFSKPINTGVLQFRIPDSGEVVFNTTNTLINDLTTELDSGTPLFIGDFVRLVIQDVNITNTTGDAVFIDSERILSPGSVVILQRMFIINFASIGTIDGSVSICDNVVFVSCGAGITLTDSGTALGTGIAWDAVNFINQSGDHITVTGTTNIISFDRIAGFPSTGDQLFNIDAVTVTGTLNIDQITFTNINGGTLGLQKTFTTDTVMDNKFVDIELDSSGGAFQVTLPDTTDSTFPEGRAISFKDLGSADTDNITIIPNPADGTAISGGSSFVIDRSEQVIKVELASTEWLIIGNSDEEFIAFGSMGHLDNAVATVISTVDTYVDIGGTVTSGDLDRFTFAGGVLTYIGFKTQAFKVTINLSLQKDLGASARQIRAASFVDSGSGFVEQGSAPMDMNNDLKAYAFSVTTELNTGDAVKVQIKNEDNIDDILIVTYNLVISSI